VLCIEHSQKNNSKSKTLSKIKAKESINSIEISESNHEDTEKEQSLKRLFSPTEEKSGKKLKMSSHSTVSKFESPTASVKDTSLFLIEQLDTIKKAIQSIENIPSEIRSKL
jgi:hypothetical protein